ncbi:MAG TPA: aldehyde dehydrogenase (NADP(+)) [Candidatus Didemnitutus sp.]|nr:aldehyde dehydrogenase (NADP(+)) [Candidatus Didemnitutus sp.]
MDDEIRSLIGYEVAVDGGASFRGFDPARNEESGPTFRSASAADVDRAARLAAKAASDYGALPPKERNRFLHVIASRLEANAAELVARAMIETALPEARLKGEVARTCGQMRLYGDSAEAGDWLDARIETAQPERKPLPKPDHRSMRRALGPVVVFGSSNFPFAYSVAGGDTASALAAGCPVIVKAHPAHPATSYLVGAQVVAAAQECGLPAGTFSLLFDGGFEVGQSLVRHPEVTAVGFTGSFKGGKALVDLAAARPVPIPVYAEMGSVNPLFILPGALADRSPALVDGLHASSTLGVGQFCTNPGLIVLQRSTAAENFVRALAGKLEQTPEAAMLSAGIRRNFATATAARAKLGGVKVIAQAKMTAACGAAPVWFETTAGEFLRNHALSEEIFGPSSVVIWCRDSGEVREVARHVEGSLTATIHAGAGDAVEAAALSDLLAAKAGRLILNGYPTGLEVSTAIVHGGPFPSTSDGGRSTSVGTRAIERWTRLICYQGYTDELLPSELQNANPRGLRRLVNGAWSSGAVG